MGRGFLDLEIVLMSHEPQVPFRYKLSLRYMWSTILALNPMVMVDTMLGVKGYVSHAAHRPILKILRNDRR